MGQQHLKHFPTLDTLFLVLLYNSESFSADLLNEKLEKLILFVAVSFPEKYKPKVRNHLLSTRKSTILDVNSQLANANRG